MKIMSFRRPAGGAVIIPPSFTLIPDSAVVAGNTPMFLADFSHQWAGEVSLAFRVGRLGKNIARKFAPRYIDGVTLALRAVALDLDAELQQQGAATGLCGAFDNGIALGRWLPVGPDQPLSADGIYKVSFEGLTADIADEAADIDTVLSLVSNYLTVKTGDIVMPCRVGERFPLRPDTVVTATLGSEEVLRIKIK